MKKNTMIVGVVLILLVFLIAGYFFFNNKKELTGKNSNSSSTKMSLEQPQRPAEINGYIVSSEGNKIIVANEIGLKMLTDEEKAARKSMTPEERQALREQETANLEKENIEVIIPVGTIIVKGSGDGSGNNVRAEISELVKGVYVSIWKSGETIEFIKLKGVSGK